MSHEIIMAGAGGDGVMLIGQLLAHAAVLEDKNVVWFPSYGPESRGGSAECMIIVSSDQIGSPIITSPDTLIVMNQLQMDKFAPKVKPGGLIVFNSSLAESPDRPDCRIVSIPASDIASQEGNTRIMNMVMLGRFVAEAKPVELASVIKALPEVVPPHRHDLLPLNQMALEKGAMAEAMSSSVS